MAVGSDSMDELFLLSEYEQQAPELTEIISEVLLPQHIFSPSNQLKVQEGS